jgi:hypothetical protein
MGRKALRHNGTKALRLCETRPGLTINRSEQIMFKES